MVHSRRRCADCWPHLRPTPQEITVTINYLAVLILARVITAFDHARWVRILDKGRHRCLVTVFTQTMAEPIEQARSFSERPRRQSIVMMAGNDCDCLICRLEATLLDDLNNEKALEEYRVWAAASEALAAFPTAPEVIAQLHRQNEGQSSAADEVIRELVRADANRPSGSFWQSVLVLVFIPTIHRTTSQISAAFPSLGREDTAQYLFATFLEFLRSEELRSRRSHLAFVVARRMRRSAFRWAIRESRLDLSNDSDPAPTGYGETKDGDESPAGVWLAAFLDSCQRRGWLTEEERLLLCQRKLEGVTSAELARRSCQSVGAVEQRIHRLLEKLRRIARKSADGTPQQLDLFRP